MRGGGGGRGALNSHTEPAAAAVKRSSRGLGGGGGREETGGSGGSRMTTMLPEFAPEAVTVNMDLFSSGNVDSIPRSATEVLPCSLQFCQACIEWQMQELEHHKEACKFHDLSITYNLMQVGIRSDLVPHFMEAKCMLNIARSMYSIPHRTQQNRSFRQNSLSPAFGGGVPLKIGQCLLFDMGLAPFHVGVMMLNGADVGVLLMAACPLKLVGCRDENLLLCQTVCMPQHCRQHEMLLSLFAKCPSAPLLKLMMKKM